MKLLLGVEYLLIALVALAGFQLYGGSWWLFAALILVPDVSFAGYLAGPRSGAVAYNLCHSWIGPLLLLVFAHWFGLQLLQSTALIWLVHIGIDRAAGYGLKHFSGFNNTHLGKIGGKAA